MILLAALLLVAPPTTDACTVIDPEFGPQYVRYAHHGKARPSYGYESEERIWFRLHNNSVGPTQALMGPRLGRSSMAQRSSREGREVPSAYFAITHLRPSEFQQIGPIGSW